MGTKEVKKQFYRWYIDTDDSELILPLFKVRDNPSILCLWFTGTGLRKWVYTNSGARLGCMPLTTTKLLRLGLY